MIWKSSLVFDIKEHASIFMDFLWKYTRKPNYRLSYFKKLGKPNINFILSVVLHRQTGRPLDELLWNLIFVYICMKICIGNAVTYKILQVFRCFT